MKRGKRIQENKGRLSLYWDVQTLYYNFLREKLGDSFKSDLPTHGGMICERGAWKHLSNYERPYMFRTLALRAIDRNATQVIFRNGISLMEASVMPESFPYMEVTNHVNPEAYGQRNIGDKLLIWECNEITDIIEAPATGIEPVSFLAQKDKGESPAVAQNQMFERK